MPTIDRFLPDSGVTRAMRLNATTVPSKLPLAPLTLDAENAAAGAIVGCLAGGFSAAGLLCVSEVVAGVVGAGMVLVATAWIGLRESITQRSEQRRAYAADLAAHRDAKRRVEALESSPQWQVVVSVAEEALAKAQQAYVENEQKRSALLGSVPLETFRELIALRGEAGSRSSMMSYTQELKAYVRDHGDLLSDSAKAYFREWQTDVAHQSAPSWEEILAHQVVRGDFEAVAQTLDAARWRSTRMRDAVTGHIGHFMDKRPELGTLRGRTLLREAMQRAAARAPTNA